MKKIVWWSESFLPTVGGGSSYVNDMIKLLDGYSHEVITQPIDGFPSEEYLEENLHIRRSNHFLRRRIDIINNIKFLSFAKSLLTEINGIRDKISYLKNKDSDIFFLLGMPMYSALHNFKKYTTIDLHNYFLDFSSIKSPKIMTLCNLPHEFDNHPVILESYNHFINQFETIICIDKHIYDYCKKYSNSFGINNNIHFIPVSINTDKFFFKSLKFGKKIVLGFAGRLGNTVDLNIINKLILNLPSNINLHLAVSGDMNLLNIPDSKLNQIRIFKDISSQMMPSFYHGIHILLNPILHKAMTYVTLEAMACGRPVIMYNLNDNETPKDNIDGFIINRDIKELLDLLSHLSNNTSIISKIGKQAFKTIKNKYSNKIIKPQIKKIFQNLLSI